jgi:hypothetical protein
MRRSYRWLAVAIITATALAAASTAQASTQATYLHLYHQAATKFGKRAPGRNIVRDGLSTGRAVTGADLRESIAVLRRMLTPAPAAAVSPGTAPTYTTTYSAASSTGGGYGNVPGVPSSFASCVAMRESTNGAGSSNIYGILGPGGTGSVAQQKAAFAQMYASRGTQPWAPYDGCTG